MKQPIVLSEIGEMLVPNCPDESDICLGGGYIGHLEFSGIFVDAYKASLTHYVIYSRKGSLRLEVPLTENTYGKLRQYCAKRIEQRRELMRKVEGIGRPFVWAPASVFEDD